MSSQSISGIPKLKFWNLKMMSASTYQRHCRWLCHIRGYKWSPALSNSLLRLNFINFGLFVSGSIDETYWVITLMFKKYGNLTLCLENYALFSLPPIFTNILYTYPLSHIIHIGEPLGSIISNDHCICIHIYMHWYDPMFKRYTRNIFFPWLMLPFFVPLFFLANNTSKTLSFFTSWIFNFSWYR